MKKLVVVGCAAVAAVFAAASAFAEGEELIANGSFEGGDTSQLDTNKAASFDSLPGGWAGEASGWAQAGTWYPSSPGAKDGTAAAWMQKGSSVISQNVTVVQAGLYKVQFYALARSSSIKDLDLLAQIDPGTDDNQQLQCMDAPFGRSAAEGRQPRICDLRQAG